jgi:hypothetical protein
LPSVYFVYSPFLHALKSMREREGERCRVDRWICAMFLSTDGCILMIWGVVDSDYVIQDMFMRQGIVALLT